MEPPPAPISIMSIAGVITGKAMYEGRFTVAEGVAALEIES